MSGDIFLNSKIKGAPSLALPFCIVVAALLHLSTIYLFNIVYQIPRVRKPSAAQVFFLQTESSASQQLGSWLQENDPAIFSPLKIIQHHRNNTPFHLGHTAPLPPFHLLPARKMVPVEPTSLPTQEAVLPPHLFFSLPPVWQKDSGVSLQKEKQTTVSFLESLAPRALALVDSAPVLPKGVNAPVAPTILRTNVDAAGVPRHAIVMRSSGSNVADEAATAWLMRQHFAPSTHETWGTLLVLWGSKS